MLNSDIIQHTFIAKSFSFLGIEEVTIILLVTLFPLQLYYRRNRLDIPGKSLKF